jgi:diguanylate cyclase (GGDEF)-like protein/PAS domain S-box-containing protein
VYRAGGVGPIFGRVRERTGRRATPFRPPDLTAPVETRETFASAAAQETSSRNRAPSSRFPAAAVVVASLVVVAVALAVFTGSEAIGAAALATAAAGATALAVHAVRVSRAWERGRAEAEAAFHRDRTRLRELEDYRRVFQNAGDAALVLEPETCVVLEANRRASDVYDLPRDGLVGRPYGSVSSGAKELRARIASLLKEEAVQEFELVHRQADGTPLHLHVSLSAVEFNDRTSVLAILRDVTERRGLEQQLRHQVFHDRLTGLANRALFNERVDHAFTRSSRGGRAIIVMFMDLDDFKAVNDMHGHAAGDELLIAVGRRITAPLRTVDTVARMGGDEFAILLEDTDHGDHCVGVACRILEELDRPFAIEGREVYVGGSIGIATSDQADSVEELLRNADLAMYAAKQSGKGAFAIFEPWLRDRLTERMDLESSLHPAVERGELEVHYQPIISLETGRITGFEALLRWDHPERGPIEPAAFIPVAEETGLILPLGEWVMERACVQVAAWRSEFPELGPLSVTVNLAPRQLGDPALPGAVRAALDASGLPPQALVLEATEDAVMQDLDAIHRVVNALDDLGVLLSIDDFGTGFSSIAHLSRLPVDLLKIDRSFVAGIGRGPNDPALAQTIIAIARTLGVETVAEGIRTHEQVATLRSLGCRLGQGFLFSLPLPADEVEQLLERGACLIPDASATERAPAALAS